MTGWAWAALALYLGWAATAFGVRAVLQRRRTGDAGFRGISGRPGTAPWWAGVLFGAALPGGAAAPAAALAGLSALPGTGEAALRWAGLVLTAAGMAFTLAAQTTMGASWRVGVDAGERTTLVTTGLFAQVRNPVFTGMAVAAVGLALMVPNPVALPALAALVARCGCRSASWRSPTWRPSTAPPTPPIRPGPGASHPASADEPPDTGPLSHRTDQCRHSKPVQARCDTFRQPPPAKLTR
ncbi:methyltransferase family protein [Streptomyces megasporus]|uniref:methyltransferase family protein n=1 Tax=Streptomyces megasporus TaxID=44060 RepID=UPI000B12A340|nr:methyltransferase [Streptomyces megasporus]